MDFFAGNFEDWFKSYSQGKLFRLWLHKEDPNETCEYVYFRQVIRIDNDWLIGYSIYDDRYEDNMYPAVDWVKLSEIEFAYFKNDEEN